MGAPAAYSLHGALTEVWTLYDQY